MRERKARREKKERKNNCTTRPKISNWQKIDKYCKIYSFITKLSIPMNEEKATNEKNKTS